VVGCPGLKSFGKGEFVMSSISVLLGGKSLEELKTLQISGQNVANGRNSLNTAVKEILLSHSEENLLAVLQAAFEGKNKFNLIGLTIKEIKKALVDKGLLEADSKVTKVRNGTRNAQDSVWIEKEDMIVFRMGTDQGVSLIYGIVDCNGFEDEDKEKLVQVFSALGLDFFYPPTKIVVGERYENLTGITSQDGESSDSPAPENNGENPDPPVTGDEESSEPTASEDEEKEEEVTS